VGQNRLITFYGYIQFPQNIIKVSVDVLRDATRDPDVDSNWRKDAMITTTIDTSSGYGFFSMRGYPFDSVSWPDGGTARARVRWTRTDGPGMTSSGIMLSWDVNFNANPGNIITVTDTDPAPAIAHPLGYLDNRRGIPHFTSQSSAETDETRKYYQNVKTTPDNSGDSSKNMGERQAFATVAMVERGQMPQGAPNKGKRSRGKLI